MRKIFVLMIALAAVTLGGCGQVQRETAKFTGYSEMCISGVTYIQFTSGATVKVDINGKPVPCPAV